MSWKKITLVSLGALAVIVSGYMLWTSITSPVTAPENTTPQTGGSLPGAGTVSPTTKSGEPGTPEAENPTEVSIVKVSRSPVTAFWVEPNGKVYYIAPDGTVSTVGEDSDTQVSVQKMAGVRETQVSPWGSQVLAAFGPIGGASWGIFDTNDRAWRPLPGDISYATWGTKSQEIVASVKTKEGGVNLVAIDLTKPTAPYRIITKGFAFSGVSLRVQLPQTLIISERSSGLTTSRVWSFDLKKLSFAITAAPEAGLTLDLGGDHKTLFQFRAGEQRVYITSDFIRTTIETLPGKCFSGSTSTEAYCFAPRGAVPELSVLPDDYYQEKFFTNDRLYRITTSSVESATLPLTSQLDAYNPIYSNDSIFFTNRPDGFVYKITPVSGVVMEPAGS